MRVLLLTTYYMHGGAGRSAARLHQALLDRGLDAHALARNLGSGTRNLHGPVTACERGTALLKPLVEMLPLLAYRDRNRLPFGVNLFPDLMVPKIKSLAPDIINLHWVNEGLLRIESLPKLKKPVVWTLHDSWAFTGGCHIPLECRRYTDACGACPTLGSKCELDLSRWTWKRKSRSWEGLPLTVVTPSRWLARCARDSSLLKDVRIEVIPNGVDLSRIKPVDRLLARELFGLAPEKKYVLFGAVSSTGDRNKGFQFLQPALQSLRNSGFGQECEVIVFGSNEPTDPPDFGLKTHYLGYLHDELTLNLLYSAADIFVAPSMQENLPNTIMEAMACGTPCVAFDVGGIPDLIDHKVNGYLATPYQAESLAQGMAWVLSGEVSPHTLSEACRQKVVAEFDITLSAQRYQKLYQELL